MTQQKMLFRLCMTFKAFFGNQFQPALSYASYQMERVMTCVL